MAGEIPPEAPSFQPREALMEPLDQAGEVAGFSKYPVVCAVTGEPGVGKTQLVAAYAQKRAREGWPVAWIHATNEDQANAAAGWDRFATALGASGEDIELFGSQWAARQQLERRLDPSLLVVEHATSPDWLIEWLPERGRIQVVLNAGSAFTDVGEPVPVVPFTEREAFAFLRQRTGSDDETGACALAGELGRLPLALDLASVVIRGERLSYADYLDRLRDLPVDVNRADQHPAPPAGDPYSADAARAILLSVRAAEQADSTGLVSLLLDMLSVLSPAGVAHWVLRDAVDALAERPGRDEHTAIDTVLDTLIEARLLTRGADGETAIMHRLVSRVLRDRARQAGRLTGTLAGVLAAVGPGLDSLPNADDPAWEERPKRERAHQLLDQVDALCAVPLGGAEPVPKPAERVLGLRRRCVRRLSEIEEHSRAIAAGTALLGDWERVAGTEHPGTQAARQELAEVYWRYGDLGEAVDLFERALADRKRALGADHPDTLTSWYSLAVANHEAWDLERALSFMEEHPLQRHGEALELYERALADRKRALAVGVSPSDRYQHLVDDVRQAMRKR